MNFCNQSLVTIDELRNNFTFNPDTGLLTKNGGNPTVRKTSRNSYVIVIFNGIRFMAHRLAWAIHYGE